MSSTRSPSSTPPGLMVLPSTIFSLRSCRPGANTNPDPCLGRIVQPVNALATLTMSSWVKPPSTPRVCSSSNSRA